MKFQNNRRMNSLGLNFKNLKFDPGNKIFKTEIKKDYKL